MRTRQDEGKEGATVRVDICDEWGPSAAKLCTVWTDPEFDPAQSVPWYTPPGN